MNRLPQVAIPEPPRLEDDALRGFVPEPWVDDSGSDSDGSDWGGFLYELTEEQSKGEMHVVNILGVRVLSHAVVLSRWMTALGLSPSQRVAETEMTRIRVMEAHMELTTRAPALYVTAAQTAKIVSLFRVDKDNPDSRVDVVCTLFARIVSHQKVSLLWSLL